MEKYFRNRISLLDSVLINVLNGEHKSRGKKELIEIDSGKISINRRVLFLQKAESSFRQIMMIDRSESSRVNYES